MPNNEDVRNVSKSNVTQKQDVHPDSEYDNWTVRSYDVTTKYEDIPEWMKMFAESSTETQDFFKFERFDYKDLNEWQKMLLKLYRKDLHNIIRYYEDYRASLVREIMDREKKEKETSSEVPNSRHDVCSVEVQGPSPTPPHSKRRHNALLFHRRSFEQSAGSSSTGSTCSSAASPSNSLQATSPSNSLLATSPNNSLQATSNTAVIPSPEPIKFKRFGHRSSKNNSKAAIGSSSSSLTTSDNGHVTADKEVSDQEGFESPKLERVIRSKRKPRGRLDSDMFSNLDNVQLPPHDFPSPQHVRSASSRYSSNVSSDFPSPCLARSASDRPARHSVHISLLHGSGVFRDSASSSNTLDSRESLFSRDSSKRGSGRAITSPKLKSRSEARADSVTVIPEKKEKKLAKFLSRATSFGRREKGKNRGKKSRGSSFEKSLDSLDARKSRKDAFLAGKETVV